MFLVPKRDFRGKRTDEVREFVETRRRHEAIWFGITRERNWDMEEHLFFSASSQEIIFGLDCMCFPRASRSTSKPRRVPIPQRPQYASQSNTKGACKCVWHPMESLQ